MCYINNVHKERTSQTNYPELSNMTVATVNPTENITPEIRYISIEDLVKGNSKEELKDPNNKPFITYCEEDYYSRTEKPNEDSVDDDYITMLIKTDENNNSYLEVNDPFGVYQTKDGELKLFNGNNRLAAIIKICKTKGGVYQYKSDKTRVVDLSDVDLSRPVPYYVLPFNSYDGRDLVRRQIDSNDNTKQNDHVQLAIFISRFWEETYDELGDDPAYAANIRVRRKETTARIIKEFGIPQSSLSNYKTFVAMPKEVHDYARKGIISVWNAPDVSSNYDKLVKVVKDTYKQTVGDTIKLALENKIEGLFLDVDREKALVAIFQHLGSEYTSQKVKDKKYFSDNVTPLEEEIEDTLTPSEANQLAQARAIAYQKMQTGDRNKGITPSIIKKFFENQKALLEALFAKVNLKTNAEQSSIGGEDKNGGENGNDGDGGGNRDADAREIQNISELAQEIVMQDNKLVNLPLAAKTKKIALEIVKLLEPIIKSDFDKEISVQVAINGLNYLYETQFTDNNGKFDIENIKVFLTSLNEIDKPTEPKEGEPIFGKYYVEFESKFNNLITNVNAAVSKSESKPETEKGKKGGKKTPNQQPELKQPDSNQELAETESPLFAQEIGSTETEANFESTTQETVNADGVVAVGETDTTIAKVYPQ